MTRNYAWRIRQNSAVSIRLTRSTSPGGVVLKLLRVSQIHTVNVENILQVLWGGHYIEARLRMSFVPRISFITKQRITLQSQVLRRNEGGRRDETL